MCECVEETACCTTEKPPVMDIVPTSRTTISSIPISSHRLGLMGLPTLVGSRFPVSWAGTSTTNSGHLASRSWRSEGTCSQPTRQDGSGLAAVLGIVRLTARDGERQAVVRKNRVNTWKQKQTGGHPASTNREKNIFGRTHTQVTGHKLCLSLRPTAPLPAPPHRGVTQTAHSTSSPPPALLVTSISCCWTCMHNSATV